MLDFQRIAIGIRRFSTAENLLSSGDGRLHLLIDGSVGFGGNHALFATGSKNSDQDVSVGGDRGPDLISYIVIFGRTLEIIPGLTGVVHEGEEVVFHTDELVILALNVGNLHVVGGWADIFKFLAGENVEGDHVNLSVPVFPSFRGGHFNDLAWAVLDHDESSLTQSRTLEGEGL